MSHKYPARQTQPPPPSPAASLRSLLPYACALLLGFGIVTLFALFFPSFMRCAPLNDLPSWLGQALFVGLTQLISPLLIQVTRRIPHLKLPSLKLLTTLTTLAGISVFVFFRFLLPTPDEVVCHPELKQMYALIEAEGQAVQSTDMAAIEKIYLPDAVIQNIKTGVIWGSPALYYGPKFKQEMHCSITHSHYRTLLLTSSEATLTTASAGTWGPRADQNGCLQTYSNPAGSDYWYFTKTDSTWRISAFRFNCFAAPDQCQP